MQTVATITKNANLIRGLLGRIEALGDDNLTLFSNHTAEGPDLSGWPILSVKPIGLGETLAPTRIATRLLVGADRINSPVRSFADIPTQG
ncbi:hypothetical protein N7486_010671 [Penicillium sp. IBT 16267x]|nr:hypothetical protein N7486_010671 [Penicillium sp. IBT 16267x]